MTMTFGADQNYNVTTEETELITENEEKNQCRELGNCVDHFFFCALDDVDASRLSILSKTVADDLELPIMYDELFSSSGDNVFFEHIRNKWLGRISTDVSYLEDTQEVIRGMAHFSDVSMEHVSSQEISLIWQDTIDNASFFEDNKYMGISKLSFVNTCIPYLQTQSTCTILAPVFNFFYLVSNAILLFFTSEYCLSFASMCNAVTETPFAKLFYYLATALLFLYHVYQNIHGSLDFRSIIEKANRQLLTLKTYHANIIEKIKIFAARFCHLPHYNAYCKRIYAYRDRLVDFSDSCLRQIAPLQWSVESYTNFGYILKAYHEIANNQEYRECFAVAIGFDAYLKSMVALHRSINLSKITFTAFLHDAKETETEIDVKNTHISFMGQSYPVHFNLLDNVTNDVTITNDNMIITGVNASGKTTVIKSLTINIIFSQQIGCGYYRSGQLLPYKHIHSYLNIPDTANRDSLFQAESRRCKVILDSINASVDDRHFCIFDELYSGTNPEEATKAASSYISYLAKYKYVTFLLTTHYYDICNYIEREREKEGVKNKKENNITNYHMYSDKDTHTNTYKLVEGISIAKNGAYRVLAEMQYPEELLQNIIEFN